MSRAGKTALSAAGFVLAAAVVGARIWSRPFASDAALVDFRDAVYYPVVAFLDGENPTTLPIGLESTCARLIAGRLVVTNGSPMGSIRGQARTFVGAFD